MKRIKDQSELLSLQERGKGFIYNDFGRATGWNEYEFNVLHIASCLYVKRMTTIYPKYFFESFEEAEEWLETNRNRKWHKCTGCLPKYL